MKCKVGRWVFVREVKHQKEEWRMEWEQSDAGSLQYSVLLIQ